MNAKGIGCDRIAAPTFDRFVGRCAGVILIDRVEGILINPNSDL